jgi:phospholipid/cholesterol/gamma-HCH transport system substrate-binding protein
VSTPANHWKLGLFVVLGFLALVAATLTFGAYRMQRETVTYQTYFDESVQGLEVGAPVKFRGVIIGTVSDIDVGADRRHVEVTSSLNVKDLTRLNLVEPGGYLHAKKLDVPSDLRAQLASAGITGLKFLQIDFFDETSNPPPFLPFPVGRNYIPAAVSTMKNLETAIVNAVDRFPVIAEQLLKVMERVSLMLEDIDQKKLPAQASAMLVHANVVLSSLDETLKRLDTGKLSKKTQETLEHANVAIARLSAVVDRLGGDKGLLVSAQRASDAMGDVARGASLIGPDLQDTLRGVQQAAESITRLADAIERDPDMLIKGRMKRAQK